MLVSKVFHKTNKITSPHLSQYKLYLKILGISYYIEDTNLFIIADIIESSPNNTYFQ